MVAGSLALAPERPEPGEAVQRRARGSLNRGAARRSPVRRRVTLAGDALADTAARGAPADRARARRWGRARRLAGRAGPARAGARAWRRGRRRRRQRRRHARRARGAGSARADRDPVPPGGGRGRVGRGAQSLARRRSRSAAFTLSDRGERARPHRWTRRRSSPTASRCSRRIASALLARFPRLDPARVVGVSAVAGAQQHRRCRRLRRRGRAARAGRAVCGPRRVLRRAACPRAPRSKRRAARGGRRARPTARRWARRGASRRARAIPRRAAPRGARSAGSGAVVAAAVGGCARDGRALRPGGPPRRAAARRAAERRVGHAPRAPRRRGRRVSTRWCCARAGRATRSPARSRCASRGRCRERVGAGSGRMRARSRGSACDRCPAGAGARQVAAVSLALCGPAHAQDFAPASPAGPQPGAAALLERALPVRTGRHVARDRRHALARAREPRDARGGAGLSRRARCGSPPACRRRATLSWAGPARARG